LSVIPHLNATDRSDFNYWGDFLRDRPDIELIAKEFQTGLKSTRIVRWHVAQFAAMQDRIGRRLGLIAIGGRSALPELTSFDSLTVIDSNPFLKAANRQVFTKEKPGWKLLETPRGVPFDEHLRLNIQAYRADFETRLSRMSSDGAAPKVVSQMSEAPKRPVAHPDQGYLWPDFAKSA
jgi:hypothetical protein